MATIRISDENNEVLKEIKREYDLPSIDKVLEILIKNTPHPITNLKSHPAIILVGNSIDEVEEVITKNQVPITWHDLEICEIGDHFSATPNGDEIYYTEEAIVLYKDNKRVIIEKIDTHLDEEIFRKNKIYNFEF